MMGLIVSWEKLGILFLFEHNLGAVFGTEET